MTASSAHAKGHNNPLAVDQQNDPAVLNAVEVGGVLGMVDLGEDLWR